MRIYTFITAVLHSVLLMIVVNVVIFKHVRSSIRRIQVHTVTSNIINDNLQRPRISHREFALLQHVIFMFVMFIIGWTPVYAIVTGNQ